MHDGQVYLIVGGVGGIGRATAYELGRRGARVAIFGRDPDALRSVAEQLGEATPSLCLAGDAASRADVERAVASTLTSGWQRPDAEAARHVRHRLTACPPHQLRVQYAPDRLGAPRGARRAWR